jgi:hypothetical protein
MSDVAPLSPPLLSLPVYVRRRPRPVLDALTLSCKRSCGDSDVKQGGIHLCSLYTKDGAQACLR